MSLTVSPFTGLNLGPKTSALTKYGISSTLDELDPSLVSAIIGKAPPTLMWTGRDLSGADELVSGVDDLIDLATPVKQQFDAALGGTCTEFNGFTDSMDAQGTGVGDVGAETVTIMWIGRPTALTNGRSLFGKRQNTGALNGYELIINSAGGVSWAIDFGGSSITRAITTNIGTTNAQVILATWEFGANNSSLFMRDGASIGGGNDVDSLTNTQVLSAGSGRTATNNHFLGAVMVWIGPAGNGFTENQRRTMAQSLGYE